MTRLAGTTSFMIEISAPRRSSLRNGALGSKDRPTVPTVPVLLQKPQIQEAHPDKRRSFAQRVVVFLNPGSQEPQEASHTKTPWVQGITGNPMGVHADETGIPPVSSIAALFLHRLVETCRSHLQSCLDLCTLARARFTDSDESSNKASAEAGRDALGRVWKDMYADQMQFMHRNGDQFRAFRKMQERCKKVCKVCTRIGIISLVLIFLILLGGTWLLAMGRPWIMCRSGSWDELTYKHVKPEKPWMNGHWGVEYIGPTTALSAFGTLVFAIIATISFILLLFFFQGVLSTVRSAILFGTGMYMILTTGACIAYSTGNALVCASQDPADNLLSLMGCPMVVMSFVCLQYFFALQASTLQPTASCLHFWVAHVGAASAVLKCSAEIMTAPVVHRGRFAWGEAPENDVQASYARTIGLLAQFGAMLVYAVLASGLLAAFSNIQARAQLSPTTSILKRFRFKLLCNACYILLTTGGTVSALITGTPSPTSQAADVPQGHVYLIYVIQTTFGVICVSALSGLMTGHRSKDHPTLANATINNRLKRLPIAAQSLSKQLGYSLGDYIEVLQAPLVASAKIHIASLKRVAAREPQAFWHLLHLESHHMYAGLLLPDGDAGGRVRDLVKQDSEFLDDLLEDARRAQAFLKKTFLPKTAEQAKLRRAKPKGMMKIMRWHRQEAKAAAKAHSPLLEFITAAFENGVKDGSAVRRKAEIQCGVLKGVPSESPTRLNRVFDIARITLQVRTAQHVLLLICGLTRLFDVVAIENRFARPTALGFMDVTVLFRFPLDEDRGHIAEIRIELLEICEARIAAMSHVEQMRSSLQYFGVRSADMEQALRVIFHALVP